MLEAIIKDKIVAHLERNQILSDSQHGFRSSRSCTTALLETLDMLSYELARGNSVDALYTDFAKAFDKVSHSTLINKLYESGINRKTIGWISNYLHQRKQRVVMGECTSEWKDVTSGVPQGSVLGPLLFIIFINDLPAKIKNLSKLYADDNKILSIVNNQVDHQSLQTDINSSSEWCDQNYVKLNGDKCKILHYGNKNTGYKYYIVTNGIMKELLVSNSEKDVGIIFNSNLQFTQHICKIVAKASRMLGLLINTFSHMDLVTYRTLYCAFVRPLLEFAEQIWSPYQQKDIDKLERVQRIFLSLDRL